MASSWERFNSTSSKTGAWRASSHPKAGSVAPFLSPQSKDGDPLWKEKLKGRCLARIRETRARLVQEIRDKALMQGSPPPGMEVVLLLYPSDPVQRWTADMGFGIV